MTTGNLGTAVIAACLVLAGTRGGRARAQGLAPGDVDWSSREAASGPGGLRFTANRGQWSDSTLFVVRGSGFVARVESDGFWLELYSGVHRTPDVLRTTLRFSFESPSDQVRVTGREPLSGYAHFLLGRDPNGWTRSVPSFGSITWEELWPGIDLLLGPGAEGELLAYEVHVKAGADPSRIGFRVEGATGMIVQPTGRLSVETPLGDLTMGAPVSWQELPGGIREEVKSGFELDQEGILLLRSAAVDPALPLVIDPGLTWASFLGGNMDDRARTMAVAPNGDVLVGGSTFSTDFPTTPGAVDVVNLASSDGFVSRLSGDGSALVFSTYIGAANLDDVHSLDLLPSGEIVVAGETRSLEFPTTRGAWNTTKGGSADGFVCRLAADGSSFVYSTFLGGSQEDKILEIQADGSGAAIVAGETFSSDLPSTPDAFQQSLDGVQDAFLARLSTEGSNVDWLTYLGGESTEQVQGLRIGSGDTPIVMGSSLSSSYPTTVGAFDPTKDVPSGFGSTFVTKFARDGESLIYSTFFEGSSKAALANGLDVNSSGMVAIAGVTTADDLPVTADAFDPNLDYSKEPFAAVLSSDCSTLILSTYLDTNGGNTAAVEAVLEDSGVLTTFGYTSGNAFYSTPGAYDSSIGSAWDVFVMRFKPDGKAPLYSSLLGNDSGFELLVGGGIDADGDAILVGSAGSQDFPVTEGAYDTHWSGAGPQSWGDAFVAKMELQPSGVTSFGNPSPSCLGDIRLTALSNPVAGDSNFTVACVGAPPDSFGFLILDFLPFTLGLSVFGIEFFVDLTQPLFLFAAASDSFGQSETTIPLPATSAGISFYLQHTWFNTAACGGAGTFSASDALQVGIQSP